MADEVKDKKKTVVKLDNAAPKEADIKVPVKVEGGVTKIHVNIFLRGYKVPIWEQAGKVAFAKHHKKMYATEEEFKELFKKY